MDWFLYDNSLRHERVNHIPNVPFSQSFSEVFSGDHKVALKKKGKTWAIYSRFAICA